ncbi:unnamed protein product [Ilex paraguariensis]|uniref:Uncharacterized protein n=1 Tax=Ilex paraguariensis TaxID=185542 RepID=A0ABC8UVV3_9AQUA
MYNFQILSPSDHWTVSRGLEKEDGKGFGNKVELGKDPSAKGVVAVVGSDGGSKIPVEARVCGWTKYCEGGDTTGFVGGESIVWVGGKLNKGIVGKPGICCGLDEVERGDGLAKGNIVSLKTTS